MELYQVNIEKHLLEEFLFYCHIHGYNPKERISKLIKNTTQYHPKIRENFEILQGLFAHLPINPNLLQLANLLKDKGASVVHYAYQENEHTRVEISFVAIMQNNLIKELDPDNIHIRINDKPFYTQSQKDKMWEQHLINEQRREQKNRLRREYEKDLRERKAKGIKTYREMDSAERREYWFAYRKKHKINLE